MADHLAHAHPYYNQRRVLTIDNLPDDVLLEIFGFYVVRYYYYCTKTETERWQSLVHVCRRWRALVFGSPRSLDLRICYGTRRFTRKSLDIWPPFPVLIRGAAVIEELVDNVILGLEHRICHISLRFRTTSQIEKLGTAMQVPFPELAALSLSIEGLPYMSVFPNSFLGGSAPRLRYLSLDGISFPGLPTLFLSATHLVNIWLVNIPDSGYISPEAMATCLPSLTSLESFQLDFKSPQSHRDLKSRRPFAPIRSVLPTLASFQFKGVIEYFEEFVARIDAPQLNWLSTTFFDGIDFDTPEFKQFIGRTPALGTCDEARLIFHSRRVSLRLRQSRPEPSGRTMVKVEMLSDRRLSTWAQICTMSLRPLLTMENLYIYEGPSQHSPPSWNDDIQNTGWLDLLRPFTAVKNLYLSQLYLPRIALAMHELTEGRTTEVLPALQNILLERFPPSEPVQICIARFISARQLTNHPVAISAWYRNSHWDCS